MWDTRKVSRMGVIWAWREEICGAAEATTGNNGTKCLNYKEGSKPRVRERGILPQDELLPFQEVGNHECGRRWSQPKRSSLYNCRPTQQPLATRGYPKREACWRCKKHTELQRLDRGKEQFISLVFLILISSWDNLDILDK